MDRKAGYTKAVIDHNAKELMRSGFEPLKSIEIAKKWAEEEKQADKKPEPEEVIEE